MDVKFSEEIKIKHLFDMFSNLNLKKPIKFLKKCSRKFFIYQDDTGSCIAHRLAKSHLSTVFLIKSVVSSDSDGKTILELLQHDHNPHIANSRFSLNLFYPMSNVQKIDNLQQFYFFLKRKYVKVKHILSKLLCKRRSVVKTNNGSIKLPNHEETEKSFEVKETSTFRKKCAKRKSQKTLSKTAKKKKYLSIEEAIAYRRSLLGKKSAISHSHTQQVLPISRESEYVKEKDGNEYQQNNKLVEHSVKYLWNNVLLDQKYDASELTVNKRSYGSIQVIPCNNQLCLCIAKVVNKSKGFLHEATAPLKENLVSDKIAVEVFKCNVDCMLC